ncbi:YybH family protein [Roseibium sp.]|uniref:YybH family protein n=1 Tax=Roseibium sp. TaxID=1936156 RepID=UPI003A969D62
MFYKTFRTVGHSAAAAILAVGLATPAFAEDGVEAVSDTFYGLLNEMMVGTPVAERIAPLWLDAEGVAAMHPVGGRDTNLAALLGAFDGVASMANGGEIRIEDQAIAVFGDTAIETGVERGRAVLADEEIALEYRVTNVYLRTEDGWRMVHHHTDLSMPIIDLLTRLER